MKAALKTILRDHCMKALLPAFLSQQAGKWAAQQTIQRTSLVANDQLVPGAKLPGSKADGLRQRIQQTQAAPVPLLVPSSSFAHLAATLAFLWHAHTKAVSQAMLQINKQQRPLQIAECPRTEVA
ncbi:hypothetical protein MMC07_000438 [Pseudocyphellaria aurata]|nr:hypothetical protein [Pseudocyphellaria aurata]